MKGIFLVLLFVIYFTACTDTKTIREEIKTVNASVCWYYVSYISNRRAFVSVEKNGVSEIVLDCNDNMITGISSKVDTIFIKVFEPRNNSIYSFKPFSSGYVIRLDSTASLNDFNKIYQQEFYKPDSVK